MEDDVSVFQDETPTSGPDDRYAGIRILWIKVIVRAIFDLVGGRDHCELDKRKEAERANTWIFQPSLLFNSFDNVCKYINVNPDVMRVRIKSMTEEDVRKIEYLERGQLPSELEELMIQRAKGRLGPHLEDLMDDDEEPWEDG
jgi:hypothetical protein